MVTASAEASMPKPQATSRTRVEMTQRFKIAKQPNHNPKNMKTK